MTLDEIARDLSILADAAEDAGERDIATRINIVIDIIDSHLESGQS